MYETVLEGHDLLEKIANMFPPLSLFLICVCVWERDCVYDCVCICLCSVCVCVLAVYVSVCVSVYDSVCVWVRETVK